VTGLILSVIGLALSMINRSAHQAEFAVAKAPVELVNVQPNATTTPAQVLAPVVIPNGQVIVAPPEELASR
jgi:hypothetical protein